MNRGLEALKVLVMSSTTIFNTKEQIEESVKTIEKELKALEIIKNSGYISIDIMLSQNYITRKEYDLLKEVLINENSN